MQNNIRSAGASSAIVMTPQELYEHWQGHRRLTRRVIEAMPEDKLFTYAVGGMRPLAALALEMIGLASAGIHGVLTGQWRKVYELDYHTNKPAPDTKATLLQRWDEVTAQIDEAWPQIPAHRFSEIDTAFGEFTGEISGLMRYWVDNEIHHRGQAYVYLRSLGIEPPAFWDRH